MSGNTDQPLPETNPGRISAFIKWFRGPPGYRRADTPTILQMEAVECGAAALGMVLAYFGYHVPLEKLRQDVGVSRDGAKATNLLKAARNYGFVAKGFKKSPQTLVQMRMPVIVFWNFNHFVVLEGFSKKFAFLNNPAQGKQIVSIEEFDQAFTGVALAIEPGPDFKPAGHPPSPWSSLFKRLSDYKKALLFILLVTFSIAFPSFIIPTFMRLFVDDILIAGKSGWLKPLLFAMFIIMLFQGLSANVRQRAILMLENRLSRSMSGRFFNHLLELPLYFFTQRYAGEIAERVALNDNVGVLMSGKLALHAFNLFLLVFFALVMMTYDMALTIVILGVLAINAIVVNRWTKKRDEAFQRLAKENGMLSGIMVGGLMGIETIKAGGAENEFFSRVSGSLARVLDSLQNAARLNFSLQIPAFGATSIANALVIGIGGLEVLQGRITPGMLVAFQSLSVELLKPFNQLMSFTEDLQEVKSGLIRIDDVLAQKSEKDDSELMAPLELQGNLEIKNLTFGYSRLDPPLIEGFSLSLTPGKRCALVGSSGSGKSTIAKLVCGLYKPWSGDILFDGKSRTSFAKSGMAGSFSFVDQDIFLFEGSVRNNLNLWDSTIPEGDIIRAAKDAEIHDEIVTRPGGYDSIIAEAGSNFSGGQRQRLEIARALTCSPAILVLDEATSALDPATEQIIDDNIRKRGCTCLIVAHRLSAIRDCDEILVLERGSIVERGTHDHLMSAQGAYSKLIQGESHE
ncbi:MAG: NHLP family bacteriocin export ABC transporter peptidase/permease/ATPase subunit [Candidatus Riflebacteria bacterium]|nr:NHLP family bacteriocin export ABC transporter peptidase/permease/ATPase subunit [Candidatus Riflebacteria bacterium]